MLLNTANQLGTPLGWNFCEEAAGTTGGVVYFERELFFSKVDDVAGAVAKKPVADLTNSNVVRIVPVVASPEMVERFGGNVAMSLKRGIPRLDQLPIFRRKQVQAEGFSDAFSK